MLEGMRKRRFSSKNEETTLLIRIQPGDGDHSIYVLEDSHHIFYGFFKSSGSLNVKELQPGEFNNYLHLFSCVIQKHDSGLK